MEQTLFSVFSQLIPFIGGLIAFVICMAIARVIIVRMFARMFARNCEICDKTIGVKSKVYKIAVNGEKKCICYECNKQITHAEEKRRRERFFADNGMAGATVQLDRKISGDVKREVWQRDNGRCVECGTNEKLEYDHIIPHSRGGSNTARNVQLLCENCNRKKSARIE